MKKYMAKLIARMEKAGSIGEVLQMHHLFKACASDVITVYAFDECFGFMDTPDFGKAFFESTDVFFYLTHLFGLVPWLVKYVQNMPTWLVKVLVPSLSELRHRQDVGQSFCRIAIIAQADFPGTVVDHKGTRDQELTKSRTGQENHLRGYTQQLVTCRGEGRPEAG